MAQQLIVMIAGETSGDLLGAGLIQALSRHLPNARFEGIGGPAMEAVGFKSLVPMDQLAVMGLIEVLVHLPQLLLLRWRLWRRYQRQIPSVFIGIDAPDFNLALETKLKVLGVPTLHYVSPSVWAWRPQRVFTVAKACHRVLTLLPFELPYYTRHNIPATFVGHPLADMITLPVDQLAARQQLGLSQAPILALLPGSRAKEVSCLAPDFLAAARLLQSRYPHLQLVVAAANHARLQQLQILLEQPGMPNIRLVAGHSRQVMAAADAVLLASGTATLEAMLLQRPMLVCYRLSNFSYRQLKRRLQTPYISLPNLLAGQPLVDELLQDDVQPAVMAQRLEALLFDNRVADLVQAKFASLHRQLARGADQQAAEAVLSVMAQIKDNPDAAS